jgi:hypothetical protein
MRLSWVNVRGFLVLALTISMWLFSGSATALPSFARQTGSACNQCHTQSFGPNLTPYGRDFKMHGYVDGAGSNVLGVPLSAMIRGSFTGTGAGVPGGAAPGYGANDNWTLDEASLFLGGRILSRLGVFSQLTYDGIGDVLALDNTDIRIANDSIVRGHDLDYGISLNNAPTVQDLWNTTPVWGMPATASGLAPTPGAAALLDGGLDGQVGGATAYVMADERYYAEAGAYASLSKGVQRAFGTFAADESQLSGGAPYWRIAVQSNPGDLFDNDYVSIGHFGMHANVNPGRDDSAGTDEFTDLGIDATYQHLGTMRNIFELRTAYIWEQQNLHASHALGNAENATNHLNTFRINGSYTFTQTYGLTLGYFNTWGSHDAGLYAPEEVAGSANGRPDSAGYVAELSYVPFGKDKSFMQPWLNMRFALQYVGYTRFNGGDRNYDGFGRDAADNNTVFLDAWLIF